MSVKKLEVLADSRLTGSIISSGKNGAHIVLKESRDALFTDFSNGTVKEAFQERYSDIIDEYFRISLQESRAGERLFKKRFPFALVAVGGYGRRELCMYSDIDILILFGKKIPADAKPLIGELLYPLWDTGLEIGYGVRTINDCIRLGHSDYEVLTSLMDARFICGDSLLYLDMAELLRKNVTGRESDKFIRWLQDRNAIRMINFGDASHLLEPNLKEGIGGLRDYNHILWMAKSLFNITNLKELEQLGKLSYQEYDELISVVRFISNARNHLHHISNRKNDRMNFTFQEEIAKRLGYKKDGKTQAVELFLEELHSSMESVKILHRSFLFSHAVKRTPRKINVHLDDIRHGFHLHQDEIAYNSAKVILDDPSILMRIFEISSKYNITLTIDARRFTREFLTLIDDRFRSSERIFRGFLNILNGTYTVEVLDQMFDTGFLDSYIPEFGEVSGRVQFDAYHIYPVGRHMLEAVSYLKNISREKDILLIDAFNDIKNKEGLLLATLFHDIGKAGKEHSKRGARIARGILERVNYPKELAEEIIFLIENHLLLAKTASRRDLNDEKIIIQSARTIGSIERLKSLLLLTWADSKATGPSVWNEWTANLIKELYFKVLHILERGELATPDASQKIERLKRQLRRLTTNALKPENFEYYFETMPQRYKLNTSAAEIVHHIEIVKELNARLLKEESPFIFEFRENSFGGYWEVCFVAKDRPGLFSDIAGIMALNNINILTANIYTWRDGTAVDIFYVTKPLDEINPDETWSRINRDFALKITGSLSLTGRLLEKSAPVKGIIQKPAKPTEVNIDNASSDFFTLVEVFATDRIGLLYIITRTLFDLHLDIRIAKIGNRGDQSADIFYVVDFDGQRIEDESRIAAIKNALINRLEEM
ncbi:MAG: [protein-PII] uridylyltransferase [Deltaproteobacteria bacterium]|nr:[protein-PII] uridylyltransferase [Deltaproteobacteria bacterium]